jgi:DNA-binding MarR family transcriptional regulator
MTAQPASPDEAERAVPASPGPSFPEDVVEIQRALARFAYLVTRARQHDRTAVGAGVHVNRAAVPILRLLAESGPLRPGEIAAQLAVEPPHIARQMRSLENLGYAEHVADPGDRRAHQVRLTPAGRDVIARVDQVDRQQMLDALSGWTPPELRQLAGQLTRMVDDFIAYTAAADQARNCWTKPSESW